jgi:uncharacterized membrane protein
MKDFLQGKWLGHSLHPIFVSLPVGLWPAALVFDLLSVWGVGGNAMVRTSFYAILLGLAGVGLAAPTGLADWWDVKRDRPAWKLGLAHLLLNVAATVLWAVNLALRTGSALEAATVAPGPLALSAAGTLVLAVSVYLGGRMVYEYGVSVARHSKEKWCRLAVAGGTRVPAEEKG